MFIFRGLVIGLELFATGTLNTPITIQEGETPIIRAYNASSGDGLEINIDSTSYYTQDFRLGVYNYLFLAQDSFASVIDYKFVVYNSLAQPTPLEFFLARKDTFPSNPNWFITQEGSGSNQYARARNVNDIALPLNSQVPSVNIITNQIRMFYSEGTFPNQTYTYAGLLDLRDSNGSNPQTYTINDGETARFQVGFLRINAR